MNGQQYIAVATGDGLLTQSVIGYAPGLNPPKGANAIYVFALAAKLINKRGGPRASSAPPTDATFLRM